MTPTPTHSDYAALLAACAADPDEDTPRLALADYLENPDEGNDPARAELIRVQVELARHLDEPAKDWEHLVAREDALLAEHEARWRRGEKCGRCGGDRRVTFHTGERYERRHGNPDMVQCPTCHGTGWERWWLAGVFSPNVDHPRQTDPRDWFREDGCDWVWRHPVHFERGFIEQVDANLNDIFQDDSPTPWALAVVRSEPLLRRFGVVDRRPAENEGYDESPNKGKVTHDWFVGDAQYGRYHVGEVLMKKMREMNPHVYCDILGYLEFDSPAAANRALAESAWAIVVRAVRAGVSGSNGGG